MRVTRVEPHKAGLLSKPHPVRVPIPTSLGSEIIDLVWFLNISPLTLPSPLRGEGKSGILNQFSGIWIWDFKISRIKSRPEFEIRLRYPLCDICNRSVKRDFVGVCNEYRKILGRLQMIVRGETGDTIRLLRFSIAGSDLREGRRLPHPQICNCHRKRDCNQILTLGLQRTPRCLSHAFGRSALLRH